MKWKQYLKRVEFWIVGLFLIRLIGITNAPLETGHNWRQSLTNMIARNLQQEGSNLLYPVIDMAGEKTGIIGSEFPFFNYLIHLANSFFGYQHWYGRLINLIVSALGIYCFYLIIRKVTDKRIAFFSAILLNLSIWFAFSRKIMPDTFSVALVLIGLWLLLNYLKDFKIYKFLLFFTLSTIGMLCKIPASILFIPSAFFILQAYKQGTRPSLLVLPLLGILASLTLVCTWYFWWVPYLVTNYQYQLYFPKSLFDGLKEIIPLYPLALEKFYFSALHSYLAFICSILGAFHLITNKKFSGLKLTVAITTGIFILFILKTGSVFPLHNYYIIPFVPVLALLAAHGLCRLPKKWGYAVLVLIAVESIANQQHDFFIKPNQTYKLTLEEVCDQTISKEDLVIINGGPSPQSIYFSNRKGWTLPSDRITLHTIDSLNNLGAQHLIWDKNIDNEPPELGSLPLLYLGKDYLIFGLD